MLGAVAAYCPAIVTPREEAPPRLVAGSHYGGAVRLEAEERLTSSRVRALADTRAMRARLRQGVDVQGLLELAHA